jgi:hypothetical protein
VCPVRPSDDGDVNGTVCGAPLQAARLEGGEPAAASQQRVPGRLAAGPGQRAAHPRRPGPRTAGAGPSEVSDPLATMRRTGVARRRTGAGGNVVVSVGAQRGAAAGDAGSVASSRRRVPRLPVAVTAVAYLAASLALHHRLLPHLSTATAGWTSSDSYQFVWWMRWLPWSLTHGANPLYTSYLHAPPGVNGMWNTPVPVLAVLFSPITLTAGPIAAYNVAMVLGPVASGLALALALGVWIERWWPRAAAGLLYGFCPFVIAHSSVGHLNLVWAVLPPALLWVVHALLVAPEPRPWRTGALAGLAFAVQTGIYTQTVALCTVVLVVVAVVLAVRFPGRAVVRTPAVLRAGLACLATYVVLCAYPLYLLLVGPGRPRSQIREPDVTNADAANLLVPTSLTKFQTRLAPLAEQLHTHTGEQGGYVGVALLAVVVVATVLVRRTRLVAVIGVTAWVLSLGVSLVVLGDDKGVALPWRPLVDVPLVGEIETMRFQVVVALCVAVVVALWLDHLAGTPHGRRRTIGLAATGVAMLTWLPADAQVATPAVVPAYFAAGAPGLSGADIVETYPRATGVWRGGARPMLWQVSSGFAYRTTGGYFIGSDPANDVLVEAPATAYQRGAVDVAGGAAPPAGDAATAARDELRALGVTAVVVVPEGADVRGVLDWTRRVSGVPGEQVDDVWLFRLPAP